MEVYKFELLIKFDLNFKISFNFEAHAAGYAGKNVQRGRINTIIGLGNYSIQLFLIIARL